MPAPLATLLYSCVRLSDMEESILHSVRATARSTDPGNQECATRRCSELLVEEKLVAGRGRLGEPCGWEADELEGTV